MELMNNLVCPRCSSNNFLIKREVTYVYTYKITSANADEIFCKTEKLPFLFDNREKSDSVECIICDKCGTSYPIQLDKDQKRIDFTILRKAVRCDTIKEPQFLG